jgi:dTDP-4-dehydrorhamnose reductase
LRLATQQKELRIVSDQVGAPTSSREIALATIEILGKIFAQHVIDPSRFDATGTYHMTASGETNWCEFANAILVEASRARQDVPWFVAATDAHQLVAQRAVAIRSDEYPTVARRPAYSVLSNSRLAQTFDVHLKDWRTQLRLLFSDV